MTSIKYQKHQKHRERDMEDNIIFNLKKLGFSINESRAYLSLLQDSPATGYELSVRTEIPRSAIYKVLKRLMEMKIVHKIENEPAKYIPLPFDEFKAKKKKEVSDVLEELTKSISMIQPELKIDLRNLRGYDVIMEQAAGQMQKAERSVYLSGWAREIYYLKPVLQEVAAKGINPVIFTFTEVEDVPARIYSYNLNEKELEDFWQHRIILVIDDIFTLMGSAEIGDDELAALTTHTAIVEIATNNIAMDLTLFGQRKDTDVTDVLKEMLEERIGRIDQFISK